VFKIGDCVVIKESNTRMHYTVVEVSNLWRWGAGPAQLLKVAREGPWCLADEFVKVEGIKPKPKITIEVEGLSSEELRARLDAVDYKIVSK